MNGVRPFAKFENPEDAQAYLALIARSHSMLTTDPLNVIHARTEALAIARQIHGVADTGLVLTEAEKIAAWLLRPAAAPEGRSSASAPQESA